MEKWRKILRTIVIFAWFGGFIIAGQWIFGAYYGPICERHAQQVGWKYESFSVGRRRGANRRPPSCLFRVPAEDGQTELRGVAWGEIPRSTGERFLVVLPYGAGILYFLPLIWIVVKMRDSR